jgi:phage shock protein A
MVSMCMPPVPARIWISSCRLRSPPRADRSAPDPREVLDYSYEQQLEMMQKVRRGVADVATSRRRVELQVTQLQLSAGKLQDQAQ